MDLEKKREAVIKDLEVEKSKFQNYTVLAKQAESKMSELVGALKILDVLIHEAKTEIKQDSSKPKVPIKPKENDSKQS